MRIPAGARALSVVLHDEHSPQVASDVQFVISEYEPLVGTKRFCGASKVLAIPAGARALYVRVLDAGSLRCDPPGVPTTGTIDVVFRR
jgi:hypothetical protein